MKSIQKLTVTKGPVHRDLAKMKGAGVYKIADPKKPIAVTKGSGLTAKGSDVSIQRPGGGSTRRLSEGNVTRSKGPSFKGSPY